MKRTFFLFLFFHFSWIHAVVPTYHPDIIVFDFGGVVAHTDRDIYAKKVLNQLTQIGIKHKLAKSLVAKAQKKSNEPSFWLTVQTKTGIPLPEYWTSLCDQLRRDSMRMDPKIDKIIHDLKKQGYKIALLSNVNASRAISIRKLGLYKPFHPVVLSCDINVEKPHKKAYKILLQKLGNVRAERCFFIDDRKENIKAAIKLGIQGVQFKSPEDLRWQLALRNILPPE